MPVRPGAAPYHPLGVTVVPDADPAQDHALVSGHVEVAGRDEPRGSPWLEEGG